MMLENILDAAEQLRCIQRFLEKGRRAQAEASGFDVGTAKGGQDDDWQIREQTVDAMQSGEAPYRGHP